MVTTAYVARGATPAARETNWGRVAVLAYGIAAYALGMSALFWVILALAGLAPMGLAGVAVPSEPLAAAFNVSLLLAFAVQHTIMARPRFKTWMTRHIPEPAERSTFVLAAGSLMWAAVLFWQPLPAVVWQAEAGWAVAALWALFAAGWAYMVAATFAIDHFDLFGLRQTWLHFRGRRREPVKFQRRWMYRYSRHPLMLGILVGVWSTPVMTVGQLTMAATLTAYIAVGLMFEERDLIRAIGDAYRQYRREVGLFTPWL